MRHSIAEVAAGVVVAMVCLAAGWPAAQSPLPQSQIPRTPDGKPDLNGI